MGQLGAFFLIKVLGMIIHSVLVDINHALTATCSSCWVKVQTRKMGHIVCVLSGTPRSSPCRMALTSAWRVRTQWPSARHSWSIQCSRSWYGTIIASWNDFIVLDEDSSIWHVCRSERLAPISKAWAAITHPKPVFFCHNSSLIPIFWKMASVNLQSFSWNLHAIMIHLGRTDTMAELQKMKVAANAFWFSVVFSRIPAWLGQNLSKW